MPTVSFSECIAPFEGIEWFLESSIFVLSTHQFGFWVKHIAIVATALQEQIRLRLRTLQFFRQFVNRPIGKRIFKSTSRVLVDFYVVRNVAKRVVVLSSLAANRAEWTFGLAVLYNCFVQRVDVISTCTFQVRISNQRGRV